MNDCGCDATISNPISSNQVCDVDVLAPNCLCLKDNTLNSWLKAISEKLCECDWETFDLSGIQSLLEQEITTLNQCSITEALVEGLGTLKEEVDTCCEEVEYPLTEVDWTPTRTIRALRKGRMVILTGALQANVSYTADMVQLPTELYPSTNLYFPVVHDFSPSASYNVFLRILPTGVIKLHFGGSAPSYGSARTVYLDGVSFFLN